MGYTYGFQWVTHMVFHIKGILSVHSFNGDYLSIPEGTGSCKYLFHEIPGGVSRKRYPQLPVCTRNR